MQKGLKLSQFFFQILQFSFQVAARTVLRRRKSGVLTGAVRRGYLLVPAHDDLIQRVLLCPDVVCQGLFRCAVQIRIFRAFSCFILKIRTVREIRRTGKLIFVLLFFSLLFRLLRRRFCRSVIRKPLPGDIQFILGVRYIDVTVSHSSIEILLRAERFICFFLFFNGLLAFQITDCQFFFLNFILFRVNRFLNGGIQHGKKHLAFFYRLPFLDQNLFHLLTLQGKNRLFLRSFDRPVSGNLVDDQLILYSRGLHLRHGNGIGRP